MSFIEPSECEVFGCDVIFFFHSLADCGQDSVWLFLHCCSLGRNTILIKHLSYNDLESCICTSDGIFWKTSKHWRSYLILTGTSVFYSSRSLKNENITNRIHIHIINKTQQRKGDSILDKYQHSLQSWAVFLLWTRGFKHEPLTSWNGSRSHGVLMCVISLLHGKGFCGETLSTHLYTKVTDLYWEITFQLRHFKNHERQFSTYKHDW